MVGGVAGGVVGASGKVGKGVFGTVGKLAGRGDHSSTSNQTREASPFNELLPVNGEESQASQASVGQTTPDGNLRITITNIQVADADAKVGTQNILGRI